MRQKNHGKLLICNDEIPGENLIPNLKYTNRRFLYKICCWIVLYFDYLNKRWVICSFFKVKQSTCQVLSVAAFSMEIGEGNKHLMSIQIYLTDFKAEWIQSKIDKSINSNSTNTKPNMKDINKVLVKAHFKCNLRKNDVKKQYIFLQKCLWSYWKSPCHAFTSPSCFWRRSQVFLFFASVLSPDIMLIYCPIFS